MEVEERALPSPPPTLDQLSHLVLTLRKNWAAFQGGGRHPFRGEYLYCPKCGDLRRMTILPVHVSGGEALVTQGPPAGMELLNRVLIQASDLVKHLVPSHSSSLNV